MVKCCYRYMKKIKWKATENNVEEETQEVSPINLMISPMGNEGGWSYPQANIRVVENKVFFYGDIDESSILDLNKILHEIDLKLQNTKNALGDEFTPVCHLHLSTLGGEVLPALSVVDTMRNMKSDVYTYVDGQVASAGTLISTAGKKRFMGKYGHLLIHQLSGGMYGKFSEMEDEIYNSTNLMKLLKTFYKDHTKLPMKKLDELLRRDIWLTPDECLSYGIIDEIL